jgi:putative hydrolase of the HAD superfamily
MLRGYEAVFFDAGETLFGVYPSTGYHYEVVARRYGCLATAEQIDAIFAQVWVAHDGAAHARHQSDRDSEREWWRAVVFDVFSRVGPVSDRDALFDELYGLFNGPDIWRLYPEVIGVLKQLKALGKKIGIISNWKPGLVELCDALGLSPYMDFILTSGEFGVAKPDPRIFHAALELARVQPKSAIHIGDSLHDDVRGAVGAGLHSVLVVRNHKRIDSVPTEIPNLAIIKDLDGLLEP